MRILELCQRDVATVPPEASVADAARLMRERHIGSVVVLDESLKPVGIVTDRDIVVQIVAAGLDHRGMSAGEIMSTPLLTVRDDADAREALASMRLRGIRRLPVVDADGFLVGIAALDDLIEVTRDALDDVVLAINSERALESWRRR